MNEDTRPAQMRMSPLRLAQVAGQLKPIHSALAEQIMLAAVEWERDQAELVRNRVTQGRAAL